jgi:hypothetical protein
MSQYHATIVLGGGVKDMETLSVTTFKRLQEAHRLNQGEPIVIAGAGPYNSPPPISRQGYPVTESLLAAQVLIGDGFNPGLIRLETSSFDTIGNAYFSRVIHADPADWNYLRVITSNHHLPRAKAIFDWVFNLPSANGPQPNRQLDLVDVSDDHFGPTKMRQLMAKEQQRHRQLQQLIPTITTLQQLHAFMFGQHQAYTVGASSHTTLSPVN